MNDQPRMLVLSEQLKKLLDQHRELEASIATAQNAMRPDHDCIKDLKKRKLLVKERMSELAGMLPPSSYAPINPSLYPLTSDQLEDRLARVRDELRRVSQVKNPSSSEVAKLSGEVRTIELEIDRRAWDTIMQAEPQAEEQLEMALPQMA